MKLFGKTFFESAQPKEVDPTTEVSSYASPYYTKYNLRPYNPDDLYQKTGTLDIYDKMRIDDQVKAVLTMKKYAILSTGWKIEAASEEKVDVQVRDFVHHCLTDGMTGSFDNDLLELLTAIDDGFSVTEQIYKKITQGDWKGKMGLRRLKTRAPHSWRFEPDDFGELKELIQMTDTGDNPLNPQKFIIYSYNKEFGNWYGNSDLRAAYRSWWSKDVVIKFWNIFLERFGMPTVVAKYKPGATKEQRIKVLKVVKNIQAKTGILLPEAFTLDMLEAVRRGEAGYMEAVQQHNKMIARAILVPDLMGFSETSGGSYALGETQFDVFLWILEKLRRADIQEGIVDEQLIKRLVDFNFVVSKYPKFKFNPLTEENKQKLADLFIKASEKGIVLPTTKDEEYMRNTLSFPKRTEEDELLPKPEKPAPQFSEPEPKKTEMAQQEFKLKRKKTEFEEKVNFKKINNDLNELQDETKFDFGKLITKIGDDYISTVFRRKIIEEGNVKEIDKINLKYLGDMRALWKVSMRDGYMSGRNQAKTEIKISQFQVGTVGNLPPKEALAYFETYSVYITGTEKAFIEKYTQQILYGAIERGETTAEAMFKLEEFFEQYKVEQKMRVGNKTVVKPIEEIPGRLETIVRTNFTNTYNQGRLGMFQDEAVKDFIPAYQYSAIIDERTSEFCERWDETILKAGDPLWAGNIPPNHFNCRSLLVPVTSDEKYKIDRPPAIKPAKGFGG